jgi:hypothetical protein
VTMSSDNFPPRVDPAIAIVATSSARLPDRASVLGACGVAGPPSTNVAVPGEQSWEDGSLVFPFGDAQMAVCLMPAPIPWSQLEGPCSTAWWWPDATQKMKSHKYHFVIAAIGGSIDPVERRVVLTRVTSAVIGSTDAVGVYWAEGTVVHEPSQFMEQAESAHARNIPGLLWLDVRVERNQDGSYRCFTTGMAPLGFLEIEVEKSDLTPDDLIGFIGDTAVYIVNNRLHIENGETMGRSLSEQFKVQHGHSMFDRPPVMRLVMGP